MIPLGYMLKQVVRPPVWMDTSAAHHICSVSGCVSPDFMDYIPAWRHNGWWFFNDLSTPWAMALEAGVDTDTLTPFYYEGFEHEFDVDRNTWAPIEPEASFETRVSPPTDWRLVGFDVVTYSVHTSPECSPLSCNNLAAEIGVNAHCLFDSFEAAQAAIDDGRITDAEPGPFRILAVYRPA